MSEKHSSTLLLPALILALGLAACGWLVTQGLVNFRSFDRSVSVKGLAVMDVEADLVIWPIKHAATGNDLPAVQQAVEANTEKVLAFLKEQGLGEKDIAARKIEVTDLLAQAYRPEGAEVSRFIIAETVIVRTNSVDAVDKASQNVGDLLRQGVSLARDPNSGASGFPEYVYTKLNDIKPRMLAEATKNARESAAQFAKDSGARVGGIKSASQGMFEIQPRDSNAAYTERQERHKTVRVVATLQFYLE